MQYIIPLSEKKAQNLALSGGKGANLAKLIEFGFSVPDGYVVTTRAYEDNLPDGLWDELSALDLKGHWAVRSSATAEDLPDNSFAGQQDTYLNVQSLEKIKEAIINCFASINNERAISYRKKNNITSFSMAVVLQQMVDAEFAGVLFTADPYSSDRFTTVIEAVPGLGEALVSGRKIPTTYKIKRSEEVTRYQSNQTEISGTKLLTDAQVKQLIQIGQEIQEKFGRPQDIEWCLKDGALYVVQSRAITTLYPPPVSPDGFKRCFISLGHTQMMTDTMLPLGGDLFGYFGGMSGINNYAGGRLYMEITHDMKTWHNLMLLWGYKNSEYLTWKAMKIVEDRKDYMRSIPKGEVAFHMPKQSYQAIIGGLKIYYKNDKDEISRYFDRMEKSVALVEAEIGNYHNGDLVRYIKKDMETKMADAVYDTTCYGIIMGGVLAMNHINKMGKKLLGEKDYVNNVGKSIPNNVTSEMGLLLGKIADQIYDDPEKIDYLKNGGTDLPELKEFMEKYGCRCPGEIDLCKPRYAEQPEKIVSILLANLKQPKGYADDMHQKGLKESQAAIEKLLEKAPRNKKLRKNIDYYRTFFGLREAPKYYWIRRYWIYKKALMAEAARLKIRSIDDIYYLTVVELEAAFDGGMIDYESIDKLKAAFASYEKLTPPRLIFSDGEVVETHYDNPAPDGALKGIGVSNGVVEGKARVITDVINAKDIQAGEILVTHFTDPSWTPVFLSIKALVAEVGGMVTHGSVIAREYGLPAVVAVNSATQLIKTGDLIRVSGDEGWVEILK